jgi:DNA-binding response OmpR family regulator
METILIVEDDVELRRLFRTALTFSGYRVLEAGDGLEALRVMDSTPVAGVVLDLGLPLVPGQVVLQEVAARAHSHSVPVVIVVTGLPGPHDELQANCVLRKPVTPEKLIATIRECIVAGSSTHGA